MSDQIGENEGLSGDRLTDLIDIASAAETRTRADALNSIRSKCKPQQLPRKDGSYEITECDECGNEIGLGRLKVAAQNLLCVYCASDKEKRK